MSVSDCCTLYDEDGTLTPASVSGSGLQSSPVTSAVAPAPHGTTAPPVGVIMAASTISQPSVTTSVQDVVFTSNPGVLDFGIVTNANMVKFTVSTPTAGA